MRLIKKYKNRKLYDTSTGKYVTLKGIFSLDGPIKVVDVATGKDITTLILFDAAYVVEREAIMAVLESVAS